MVYTMVNRTDKDRAFLEFTAGDTINIVSALKVMRGLYGEKSAF